MLNILMALLLVLSLVVVAVYFLADRTKRNGFVALIPVAILALWLLFGIFVTVPAGYAGVLLRFGKVEGVLPEGLNTKVPFIDTVVNMSVQTQLYQSTATAASRDLQDVKTTIAINYKIAPETAGEIYRTLGVGYIAKVAEPATQETVKEVTARFNAEDMILKRTEVKDEVTQALKAKLALRSIVAETVNVTNFDFSPDFTRAIEAKVVAAQNALQAENKLQQVTVEAKQAEARAKGEAAAVVANAQGKAQSIQIVTDAQIEANKKIASSLTPDVLQYIFLDRLSGDIKVVVIPSGQQFTLGDLTK